MEPKTVTVNKKLLHTFEIVETFEAGIALRGSEVKSLREGKIDVKDAFCLVEHGEVWLVNCRIPLYAKTTHVRLDPGRKRKLLLNRREIERLAAKIAQKGFALKPSRVYFNARGFAKVEIGLCRHKKTWDRRDEIRDRELDRQLERYKKGQEWN
jgi:SsrA-binding protein